MYDKYYIKLPLNYSFNNNNYINYLNLLYNDYDDFDLVDYFNVITNINNQFENNIFDFDSINKDLSVILYKNKSLYNPINYSILRLNGVSLASYTSEYFNYIQPYSYYNCNPSLGVNVYSFSLNPLEVQPSGSCNFSRFLGQNIGLTINEEMFYYAKSDIDPTIEYNSNDDVLYNYTDVIFNMYAIGYNILRINGGFAGLAFSFT
jgi:hypothetical protein